MLSVRAMLKWPVKTNLHNSTKHAEHQDTTGIQNKLFFLHIIEQFKRIIPQTSCFVVILLINLIIFLTLTTQVKRRFHKLTTRVNSLTGSNFFKLTGKR